MANHIARYVSWLISPFGVSYRFSASLSRTSQEQFRHQSRTPFIHFSGVKQIDHFLLTPNRRCQVVDTAGETGMAASQQKYLSTASGALFFLRNIPPMHDSSHCQFSAAIEFEPILDASHALGSIRERLSTYFSVENLALFSSLRIR